MAKSRQYPTSERVKKRYDAFIRAYITNGRNATQAALSAGYGKNSARAKGCQLLTLLYIQEQLDIAEAEAIEKHNCTLEKRIRWLEGIVSEGLHKYKAMNNQRKPHDLKVAVSAISELNKMLGTTTDDDETPTPVQVNITVSDASNRDSTSPSE